MTISITPGRALVTFINVFTVKPDDQARLVELLTQVTERTVRNAPGFLGSALHRSVDGTRVTMYGQWRSLEDYEAMRRDPSPAAELRAAMALATFELGQYEVAACFEPLSHE